MKRFFILVALVATTGTLQAKGEFWTGGRALLEKHGILASFQRFIINCDSLRQEAYRDVLGDKFGLMQAGVGEFRLAKSKGNEINHGFINAKAKEGDVLDKDIDVIEWRQDSDSQWIAVAKIGDDGCLNPLDDPEGTSSRSDRDSLEDLIADGDHRRADRDTRSVDRGHDPADGHGCTVNVYCGGCSHTGSGTPPNPRTETYWASYPYYVAPPVASSYGCSRGGNGLAAFFGGFAGSFLGNMVSHKRGGNYHRQSNRSYSTRNYSRTTYSRPNNGHGATPSGFGGFSGGSGGSSTPGGSGGHGGTSYGFGGG